MLVLNSAVAALIEGLMQSPLRDLAVGALLIMDPTDCDDIGIEWAPRRRIPRYEIDNEEERLTQDEALRQLDLVQTFVTSEFNERLSLQNQIARLTKRLELQDVLLVGEGREPLSLITRDARSAWRFHGEFRDAVRTAETLIRASSEDDPTDGEEGQAHG